MVLPLIAVTLPDTFASSISTLSAVVEAAELTSTPTFDPTAKSAALKVSPSSLYVVVVESVKTVGVVAPLARTVNDVGVNAVTTPRKLSMVPAEPIFTVSASSVVLFVSIVPWATIFVPTVTFVNDPGAPPTVYVVAVPTRIVRLNPCGSVMVMVLPLTAVTVPKSSANSMFTAAAIVGSVDDVWMLTRSPATSEVIVEGDLPSV